MLAFIESMEYLFVVFLGTRGLFGSPSGTFHNADFGMEVASGSLNSSFACFRHFLSSKYIKSIIKQPQDKSYQCVNYGNITAQWLPESARFHVASGEQDKALATLQKVAEENGKPMLLGRLVMEGGAAPVHRGRVKDLLGTDLRKTSILLWFIW